jgi:flagellar motor switch protein FliN/FliY
VLAITPGTLVTFTKNCEEPLDLYVNNQLYGHGEAVKIGENFGLKINTIGTTNKRVQKIVNE